METNLSQQLFLLMEINKGEKLETILEKVFEEDIYLFNEFLNNKNLLEVNKKYTNSYLF
jgi:hypothetical protein